MKKIICGIVLTFLVCFAHTILINGQSVGVEPKLFAPGIVSTEFHETSSSFTPDGKTVYFTRSDFLFRDNTILESHFKNNRWSKPEVAPFSGVWRDSEPRVSPDGNRLYFVSNRPPTPDTKPLLTPRGNPGANIWYVNKTGDKWSEPIHIDGPVNAVPTVYNPSVAKSGNLYFSGNLPAGGVKNQVYFSRLNNNQYEAPELLSFSDKKWNNLDPYISPDEKFMLFISDRSGDFDIYISFQNNGQWSEPKNQADSVYAKWGKQSPNLAPDGKTLYFTSSRRLEIIFPKQKENFEDVDKRLRQDMSRNIFQVDISSWLNQEQK